MFRSLLPRLLGDTPPKTALSHDDAEVAVAALLVRVARADNHYGDHERQLIDVLLARDHQLTPNEVADRRAAAEMIEAEAPDTVRFTRAIKERIPLEERSGLIASMWEIALSDGHRSAEEDAMIRLVANLLGVTDVESAQARRRVDAARA